MSRTPRLTDVPNFKNAPLVGLAEGNGSFSNYVLASLVLGLPWLLKRVLPFVNRGGFKTYFFLTALLSVPITIAYWTLMSMFGPRKNEKVVLPGKARHRSHGLSSTRSTCTTSTGWGCNDDIAPKRLSAGYSNRRTFSDDGTCKS